MTKESYVLNEMDERNRSFCLSHEVTTVHSRLQKNKNQCCMGPSNRQSPAKEIFIGYVVWWGGDRIYRRRCHFAAKIAGPSLLSIGGQQSLLVYHFLPCLNTFSEYNGYTQTYIYAQDPTRDIPTNSSGHTPLTKSVQPSISQEIPYYALLLFPLLKPLHFLPPFCGNSRQTNFHYCMHFLHHRINSIGHLLETTTSPPDLETFTI